MKRQFTFDEKFDQKSLESAKAHGGGDRAKNPEDGDDRFWKLEIKKDTWVGGAVIRFLPDGNLDSKSHIFTMGSHFVNLPNGRKFSTMCANNIGQDCPLCQLFWALQSTKDPIKVKEAKNYSKNRKYISNILVIKDPANPQNEGKVFLWKYDGNIFEMVKKEFERYYKNLEGTVSGLEELDRKLGPFNPFNPTKSPQFLVKTEQGIFNENPFASYKPSKFLDDISEKSVLTAKFFNDNLAEKLYDLTRVCQEVFKSPSFEEIEDMYEKALNGSGGSGFANQKTTRLDPDKGKTTANYDFEKGEAKVSTLDDEMKSTEPSHVDDFINAAMQESTSTDLGKMDVSSLTEELEATAPKSEKNEEVKEDSGVDALFNF